MHRRLPILTLFTLAGALVTALIIGCPWTADDSKPPNDHKADTTDRASKNSATEQGTAPGPLTATVTIDQFAFEPATLTVKPGTTIEWVNRDDVPHTVVDSNKSFRSQALDTDDVFRQTFSTPGDYHYFCSVHPHMVGDVHVKN